jgi:hypothetical protein
VLEGDAHKALALTQLDALVVTPDHEHLCYAANHQTN